MKRANRMACKRLMAIMYRIMNNPRRIPGREGENLKRADWGNWLKLAFDR
jgi:hypothetical protein